MFNLLVKVVVLIALLLATWGILHAFLQLGYPNSAALLMESISWILGEGPFKLALLFLIGATTVSFFIYRGQLAKLEDSRFWASCAILFGSLVLVISYYALAHAEVEKLKAGNDARVSFVEGYENIANGKFVMATSRYVFMWGMDKKLTAVPLTKVRSISTKKPSPIRENAAKTKVYFERNKSVVHDTVIEHKNQCCRIGCVAETLRKWRETDGNENVHVILEGHADPRGTWTHNLKLSEKRVEAVQNLLERYGLNDGAIDIERVIHGESEPKIVGRADNQEYRSVSMTLSGGTGADKLIRECLDCCKTGQPAGSGAKVPNNECPKVLPKLPAGICSETSAKGRSEGSMDSMRIFGQLRRFDFKGPMGVRKLELTKA